ncbi:hypothetical protein BC835DRAFT_1397528 [Cytidiella melzeri]|nr:hypothetical protein BC835DRAFT_1397528 [Cytidiella melzeri]
MKFATLLFFAAAFMVASVSLAPIRRSSDTIDLSLIPEFGIERGKNPRGDGNCDGALDAQGHAIPIPCECPPLRKAFIDALNENTSDIEPQQTIIGPAGLPWFPRHGNSTDDQIARLLASRETLRRFTCPDASSTFSAQLNVLQGNNGIQSSGTAVNSGASPLA